MTTDGTPERHALEVVYRVVRLEDVLRYYLTVYPDEIEAHEAFVDPSKGKVVFRLTVRP